MTRISMALVAYRPLDRIAIDHDEYYAQNVGRAADGLRAPLTI